MLFSSVFKAKARAVLQQHWQTALLIALIVNLPSLLVQGIGAFTHSDPMLRLENLLMEASRSSAALNAFPESVRAMLSETGVLVISGLSVLAWLVTPALSLGMNHWTLDRIRGEEEPVSTVLSRLGIFLKGIGLRIMTALRVLLWMLPGVAVFVLAMIPLWRADASSAQSVLSAANTSMMLMYFALLAMLVLGLMGYLRYALADLILADEPQERVLSCLRRSKTLMNGRTGALLGLMVSFILWYFLVSIAATFAAEIAGDVAGLLIQMLGSLFISVYMLTSRAVFYEALRTAPLGASPEPPAEEPPENLLG